MLLEKGTFSLYPASLMRGRNPAEQTLMIWLCFHANQEGECFPSLNLLAEETGLSRNSVIKHLGKLCKLGLIIKTKRNNENNGTTSNLYKVCLTPTPVQNLHPNHSPKSVLTPVQNLYSPQSKICTQTKLNITKLNITKKEKEEKEEKENALTRSSVVKEKVKITDDQQILELINRYTEYVKLRNALYEFVKMRKKIKKPLSAYSMQLILNKLSKLSEIVEQQIEILEQSIRNNWQDVFALKNEDHYNANNQRYRYQTPAERIADNLFRVLPAMQAAGVKVKRITGTDADLLPAD